MKELLFNPFKRLAGAQALLAGLGVLLISALLASFFGLRYDGALDAHFVGSNTQVTFSTSVSEQLINLACLFAFLYPAALLSGAKQTRPVDIAGTLALARFPYVLLPLLNIGKLFSGITDSFENITGEQDALTIFQDTNIIGLLLLSIPLIGIVVWTVALFFKAYKVSTNLKGTKLIVSFVIGLLLAEITSIYIIRTLL